ncbi:DNA-binding protein [Methylorubrum populi]|jgi:hypothetical protein|uniref:helix-turn-helix transcriptional regulator n=1 Tax=Methylobacteriaceae TaxID=119045 RepID=UPI0025F2367B|nr:DNA-binding protein [Methylobacterium sp.]MBX9934657.1 DNA-binding protein [Methylobacterium sp.]
MTEYRFTLKYRLSSEDRDAEALVERLGEAGCTDALVGVGIAGRLALDFTREADSAQDAIRSALADVKEAIPTASLIEVAPDFVGLTDIADLMGVARQSMRKQMLGHSDFPLPVHEGPVSIWHLEDVLGWLDGRKGYKPDTVVRETATVARTINMVREARRYASNKVEEIECFVV